MNAPLPHHLAAVWFADIVGYTAQSDSDEAVAQRLVHMFATTTKEVATRYGGRVVKFLGDGALVEFPSTELAVRSAWALTTGFPRVAESAGLGERRLRVGVHVGDVAQGADGDLFGDGVNVASRLQGMADAGEVWVSDDVRRQLRQRREFVFDSRGERGMKGFDRPVEIHAVEVVGEEDWVPVVPREVREPWPHGAPDSMGWLHRIPRSALFAAAMGLVLLLGLGAWWLSRGSDGSPPDIPADPPPAVAIAAPDRSIAVLPFENLSPDPNDAFFAAGIADDILSALARIPEMDVISRTSTAQYEGTTKPVRQIAEELGVGNVLEGSVRRAGNRIRIVVQLIDARTDRHLWTETYDRELTDVFAVQSEIAERIASALDAALTTEAIARIAAGGTDDPEAYALFLKGRELLYAVREDVERVPEEARAAESLFRRALDRDPEYAAAWAGLANSLVLLGWTEDRVYADSAAEIAEKAVKIDPTSSQAYVALAHVHGLDGRVSDSHAAAARAVELEPNDPDALGLVAGILMFVGRFDEALPTAKKLVRVEPTQPLNSIAVASIYTSLEMYEEAEVECRSVIELLPDDATSRVCLADIEFLRGNLEGAKRELETARILSPMNPVVLSTSLYHEARRGNFEAALRAGELYRAGMSKQDMTDASLLVYLYQRVGDLERARALFREEKRLEEFPSEADEEWWRYLEMARLAILDSHRDEALHLLGGAYDRGFRDLVRLRLDPILAMMEGDPGYTRWVARIEADVARMRERVRAVERQPQD